MTSDKTSVGPIPAGWEITYNGLDVEGDYGEDMLQARHRSKDLVADLGWYGGCGEFVIYVYEHDFQGRLLTEIRTPDLMAAAVRFLGVLARYA